MPTLLDTTTAIAVLHILLAVMVIRMDMVHKLYLKLQPNNQLDLVHLVRTVKLLVQ